MSSDQKKDQNEEVELIDWDSIPKDPNDLSKLPPASKPKPPATTKKKVIEVEEPEIIEDWSSSPSEISGPKTA